MKQNLKSIIKTLNPKLLGVKKIEIGSFKKLGIGEGNLNYIFKIGDKKFICRVNIDKSMPNNSKDEFNALKKVENLKISPKVYYLHEKYPNFIILEFIKGKPFHMKKRTYTKLQIKQISHILAELHSKKCKDFSKKNYFYQYYIKEGNDYIKSINKYSKKFFSSELDQINKKFINFIPKKETHEFSLIHGDVCPQNILETNNGLRLIDWESLQYSDPAKDIANILIDLKLRNNDLNLFLKEYHKLRKDDSLLKRAKVYAVLMIYCYFLWEILRSFEIIKKELPKEYLNKTTAQSHINEAKFQLRKLRKLIDIPNINVDRLFLR